MASILCALLIICLLATAACGQLFQAAPGVNPDWGDEGRTAPAGIFADFPVVYEIHDDVPSRSGNPSLIGPVQFLRRADINEEAKTVDLPLYQGEMQGTGKKVWYVLTETTNLEIANQMGLTFTTKMRYTAFGTAVRTVTFNRNAAFIFDKGTVDFSPVHSVVAGSPEPFPLASFTPGSVGDAHYTPIVKTPDGIYYNAPVVAFDVSAAVLQTMAGGNVDYTLVHDKVVAIDPANFTVTLKMTAGASFSKPIFYLSTDASDAQVAAIESVTWAPALTNANETDRDIDSIPGQGNERLGLVVNGPQGVNNPFRQGLYSAIIDKQDPLNIFGGIPTVNLDYSPIWNIEFVYWTEAAINAGYRTRITSFLPDLFSLEAYGVITGTNGSSIERSGLLINCPVLSRLV